MPDEFDVFDAMMGSAPQLGDTPELSELAQQRQVDLANRPPYRSKVVLPFMSYSDEQEEDDIYDPMDFPTVGKKLRENITRELGRRFPITTDKFVLKVENLKYSDAPKREIAAEKDALLHAKTLQDKLTGDYVLYDKTSGKELQRKSATILGAPRMTPRGTFIRNGSEYALKHMFRLRPGIYTRVKANGLVSAHINPAQTTGRQAQIEMDPETGVFTLKRGTRNYGLLPLLQASGLPEEALRKAWGDELYEVNAKKYGNLKGSSKFDEYEELWNDGFKNIKLDPETTSRTLGTPYEDMKPEALLQATGKMLNVYKQAEGVDTDDRDGLQFQKVLGPADFIAERIVRDGGGILRKLANTIDRDGNLDSIPVGLLQPHVDSVFLEDRHAAYVDGASPLDAYDQNAAVTRIGEGGIGDLRAAPMESRNVQNSYANFIDPIRSPECYDKNTEIMTDKGWISVQDMTTETKFACLIDGERLEYHPADKLTKSWYTGPMYGFDSEEMSYNVTPNHRMWIKQGPSSTDTFSIKYAAEMHRTDCAVNTSLTGVSLHHLKASAIKNFNITDYDDYVYCPTVPGGLVYVRRHNKSGFWCGNSMSVGLVNYLSHGIKKNSKGMLFSTFLNNRTKKVETVDMTTAANSIVAFPEYNDPKADPNEMIPAIVRGGEIDYVPRKDVDYFLNSTAHLMSTGASMIPGAGGIRSNRMLMGCLPPTEKIAIYRYDHSTEAKELITRRDVEIGSYVPEDGDMVLCFKEYRNIYFYQKVLGVYSKDFTGSLYTLTTDLAGPVKVTGEHRIPIIQSFNYIKAYKASDVKAGMFIPRIIQADTIGPILNYHVQVRKISSAQYTGKVYDLDADDNYFMLSNGVFVHNSKYPNTVYPLMQREAPLVQREYTDDDGNVTTMENIVGQQLGARKAPIAGKVLEVTPEAITIMGADGKRVEVELYNNLMANQKGFLHNTPEVKAGDMVRAGDVLASSNYTDSKGTAALGKNLRIAYTHGKNAGTFEDAIKITESAAQALASVQMYRTKAPIAQNTEYDKKRFLGLFGAKEFTKDQLDKLDDTGVAKVGTVLNQGDPVVVGIEFRKTGTSRKAAVPIVETWDHEYPGEVTDVSRSTKNQLVYTKAYTPVKLGDKLCYDDKTELYTSQGWMFFEDYWKAFEADRDIKVLTLDYCTGDYFLTDIGKLYAYGYDGILYKLETPRLDMMITPNHKVLSTSTPGGAPLRLREATEIFGVPTWHLTGLDMADKRQYASSKDIDAIEEWVKYKGFVYCAEVPVTHTLYVRRNGKTYWSGNSGRYGSKGVVSDIIPDNMALRDSRGNIIDIEQSGLGIVSRVNPEQLNEASLGKVADLTGKPIAIPDFMANDDLTEFARQKLREAGFDESGREDLQDPETGLTVPSVMTGKVFIMRTKHTADTKRGGRSTGEYTQEEIPLKGGQTGCFLGSQQVLTLRGYRNIGDIVSNKLKDPVWSYSVEDKKWSFKPVVNWFQYEAKTSELLRIVVDKLPSALPDDMQCSATLYVTPQHLIYLPDGSKVSAGSLKVGDTVCGHLVTAGDTPTQKELEELTCTVSGIGVYNQRASSIQVYDIEVEGNHNYMAGGILVSNSRRMGSMEVAALLGHRGGMDVIRDAKLIRGQRNDDFWRDFRSGKIPDQPGTPLVHKKFFAHLQAAGLSLEDRGDRLHLFSATDSDIKRLTQGRQVKNPATYDSKTDAPIPGGLFDKNVFGDDGSRWGYYELPEPVLNPPMMKSVASILGWTDKQMKEVMNGASAVKGKYGAEALQDIVKSIDVPKEFEKAKEALKAPRLPASKRDKLLKRYRALGALVQEDKDINDLFLTRIPILPPRFRPLTEMASGVMLTADANLLYKRLIDAAEDFKEAQAAGLPEEAMIDAREALAGSVQEVIGLKETGDPKLQAKQVGGLLKWAFGKSSPKLGSLQRKVFGATVDVGGRGSIIPDNTLNIDQMGISEKTAWSIFEPFVMRRLTQQGFSVLEAMRFIRDRKPEAVKALGKEMEERPVIFNRAPTMHKENMGGFFARIRKGDVLRMNPTDTDVQNADFDGNCVDHDSVIFLRSALDNEIYRDIVNSYKPTKELSMINREATIVAKADSNMVCGPIGDFPIFGDYVLDAKGAKVYPVPAGIEILSFDPVTATHSWEEIKNFTVEENCPSVEIRLSWGRKVIVSSNESMAIFDDITGSITKAAPADLENKFIPAFKRNPVPFGTYGNRELGWVHGMFLSDGWISRHVIGLCKLEDRKRETFIEYVKRNITQDFTCNSYFEDTGSNSNKLGSSAKVHLYSKALAQHFTDLNLYDWESNVSDDGKNERSCNHKRISPDMLNEGSEEYLWGLLSGLLDGDGSIVENNATKNARYSARISTSSPHLRDSIVQLGFRLGIRVNYTTTAPRGWSKEAYIMNFSTCDLRPTLDNLSLVGERETAILNKWRTSNINSDKTDLVPLTKSEVNAWRKIFRAKKDETACASVSGRSYLSRWMIEKKLSTLTKEELAPFVELRVRAQQSNTLWLKAESIVDAGARTVYDFEVANTKLFAVNNGIVVYDTMQLHVPVSKQAVRSIINNMLPSRSLLSTGSHKVQFRPLGEFAQGLYLANRIGSGKPVKFATRKEAEAALRAGKIRIDTPIEIDNLT